MRALLLVAVALGASMAGCAIPLFKEPTEQVVEGRTDGYAPGSSLLKVFVRDNASGEFRVAAFDRRDWYAARIADDIDHGLVRFLRVEAMPRATLGEYLVLDVESPDALAAYRYDRMDASAARRQEMDDEYGALLARLGGAVAGDDEPAGLPDLAAS